jgi:hypothetical protein
MPLTGALPASMLCLQMKLTSEQLKSLGKWASEGKSLSEIQKLMESVLNLRVTYMELRFLMDDYAIEIVNQEKKAPAKEAAKVPEPGLEESEIPAEEAQEAELAGGVTVDVDPIVKPGAVISGGVTFSDGVKAKWYLDQMGRLGLDGVGKNYRPSDEDVQDFQTELQRIIQKKGF